MEIGGWSSGVCVKWVDIDFDSIRFVLGSTCHLHLHHLHLLLLTVLYIKRFVFHKKMFSQADFLEKVVDVGNPPWRASSVSN